MEDMIIEDRAAQNERARVNTRIHPFGVGTTIQTSAAIWVWLGTSPDLEGEQPVVKAYFSGNQFDLQHLIRFRDAANIAIKIMEDAE
jgi:hypothetical protein